MIKAKRLSVTLNMTTPLAWLERHGEIRPLEYESETPQEFGIWLPVLQTWRELGIDMPEAPLGTMASQFGQVPIDGGSALKFLISFRRVYESDAPPEAKWLSYEALAREHPEYALTMREWLSPPALRASTLAGQCEELGWELRIISAASDGKRRWIFNEKSGLRPEQYVEAMLTAEGRLCNWCEGESLQVLIKAAALGVLVRLYMFKDREDAVRRTLPAQ